MSSKKIFLGASVFVASGVIGAVALTSAYLTDRRYEINRDAPTLASDTISTISCYLGKLKAEDVLHAAGTSTADPYAVWVDVEACKSATNVANDGATVTPPTYDRLWVKPSVENGVLRAKVWALTGTGAAERRVYFNAYVRSAATNEYPFGLWEADWCVERDDRSSVTYLSGDTCFKKGHIVVDEQGYKQFYDFKGSGTPFTILSSGIVNAGSETGLGRYSELRNNNSALTLNGHFAFGPGALLDVTNGAQSCKNPIRNAQGTRSSIWQAWLYDRSTGDRVPMNGGFPVQNVSTREAGWAGFDGIRISGTGNPVSAGNFRKIGSNETYSAFGSFGKLIKITPTKSVGLDNLAGLVLRPRLIESDILASSSELNLRSSRQKMLMYWDANSDEFVITHRDIGYATSEKFKPLTPHIRYSVQEMHEKLRNGNQGYRIWAYQMGSNNDYVIHLANQSTSNTPLSVAQAYFYKQVQTQVYPGEPGAPTDLFCIGRCADSTVVNGRVSADYDKTEASTLAAVHRFDAMTGDMNLVTGGQSIAVNFATITKDWTGMNLDPVSPDLWMDAMVEQSQLADLSCSVWDGTANVAGYCSYPVSNFRDGVQSLSHYYVWNTGINRWNKFYGLKDDQGRVVRFDEPKVLTYDAPNTSDFGYFAGKKATLRYPGEGRLWLPGKCVNVADSSLPTSAACNNPDGDRTINLGMERWVHDFEIPFEQTSRGTLRDDSGNEYLVKWTRKGTYYPNIDMASCNGLQNQIGQAALRSLPSQSNWRNPMDPNSSEFIGSFADNYPANYPSPIYVHGVRQ